MTIWIIAEDETDYEVMKTLLALKGIQSSVRRRRLVGNRGGVGRLSAQLERLIGDTQDEMVTGDCILVLHDADELNEPHDRQTYERIAVTCRRYSWIVTELIARDELESWLLADSGLCQWLEIKPKSWDKVPSPKSYLRDTVRTKRKVDYPGRLDQILMRLDGDGDRHSASMREAFKMLSELDCVKA